MQRILLREAPPTDVTSVRRRPRRLTAILIAALVALGISAGQAQDYSTALSGPSLGFVFDAQNASFRKILGMPGAAIFSAQFGAGIPVEDVHLSPGHPFGVALAGAERQPVVLEFPSGSLPAAAAIREVFPAPEQIALSPDGVAAAFAYPERRLIQLVSGLPGSPTLLREVDLAAFPLKLTQLAISDDANTLLVAFAEGGTESLHAFSAGAAPRFVFGANHVAALAFVGADALILDGEGNLYRSHVADGADEVALIASSPLLSDAREFTVLAGGAAAVARTSAGAIAKVDLKSGTIDTVPCNCRPDRLQPLSGNSFLLTAPSANPVWLLDAGPAGPRTVFIPQAAPAIGCRAVASCAMKGSYVAPVVPTPVP